MIHNVINLYGTTVSFSEAIMFYLQLLFHELWIPLHWEPKLSYCSVCLLDCFIKIVDYLKSILKGILVSINCIFTYQRSQIFHLRKCENLRFLFVYNVRSIVIFERNIAKYWITLSLVIIAGHIYSVCNPVRRVHICECENICLIHVDCSNDKIMQLLVNLERHCRVWLYIYNKQTGFHFLPLFSSSGRKEVLHMNRIAAM